MSEPREPTTAELLRDGFRWFAADVEAVMAQSGAPRLTAGAALAMGFLGEAPTRASELAVRLRVSRQRVFVVVRELTAAGMVEVRPDPDSARERRVSLTAVGAERHRTVTQALAELDSYVASALGPDDLRQLRHLLVRLADVPARGDRQ